MSIDPNFVDVDFPSDPNFVPGDTNQGNPGGFDTYGSSLPNYEEVVPVIPESQWKAEAEKLKANGTGLSQLVSRIFNQLQEGSCVANACSQAFEIAQANQWGKDRVVHIAAMGLYKRIGSSPNSGANVADGLEEMATRGCVPLDDDANKARFGSVVMPNTGWRNSLPSGWEAVGKELMVLERYIIRSVGGLVSALFNGHPVVVGRAGHSICYCDPVYDGNNLLVKYANSWGDWGEAGFGHDSIRLIQQSAGWCFAVRSIVKPSWITLPDAP